MLPIHVYIKGVFIMIEVTFRIESLDYTDKLDSQLPLVLEALSQSGNINPVLLYCYKVLKNAS